MTNLTPRNFVVLLLLSTMFVVSIQLGLGATNVAAQDPIPGITPGPQPTRVTTEPTQNFPTTVPITRPPLPTPIPTVTPIPVPDACLNDYGTPVIPRIEEAGVKALTLNFNHYYSPTQTEGCVATRNPTGSDYEGIIVDDIGYEVVVCNLVGNVPADAINAGSAHFNGEFHIECDMFARNSALSNFYVYAEATFWNTGKTQYQIMEHPDVSVRATVNQDWAITLASNYNGQIFGNKDAGIDRSGQMIPLLSRVHNGTGKHFVAGNFLKPGKSLQLFGFVTQEPIMLGQTDPDAAWDLHFIAIDPPNSKG